MQLSGMHHQKRQVTAPTDRTPRDFEMMRSNNFSTNPGMISNAAMAFGAGTLYTNAVMGQGPSAAEREHARKASSTILKENSIRVEESDNGSSPDSWSMHFNCTNQAPYSIMDEEDVEARTDLHRPPQGHSLRELADFLRKTGPNPPHRQPSKIEYPSRTVARKKKAMQFLKLGQYNVSGTNATRYEKSCAELRDEGGLLANLSAQAVPKAYEQKVSSTGQRYLALQEPQETAQSSAAYPMESPSVLDSRVSIYLTDSINPIVTSDKWKRERSVDEIDTRIHPAWRRPYDLASTDAEAVIGAIDHSIDPVRPRASDPPTPEPLSAVSFSESSRSESTEQPSAQSCRMPNTVVDHRLYASTSSSLPLPQALRNAADVPMQKPAADHIFHIKQPSPRRLASHTALLQRSSTISSCHRGLSDSPEPPPRSPLRLRRNTKNIEDIITSYGDDTTKLKVAPAIQHARNFRAGIQPIRPTVVTDCTGPIKRPKSRGSVASGKSNTRMEREERARARKMRDRPLISISNPIPLRAIDAIVHAPLPTPRHRLKKARPHIQIPDLNTVPLTARASSSASSDASWKKVTETMRTPVSAVPSEETPTTIEEKTGYTPISPTASNGSVAVEAMMALSPVMLVAEEVPVSKARSPPKPARLVVREGKSYAPRPRSASIPRNALNRRSRPGGRTPSTPNSPSHEHDDDEVPPLPSPPLLSPPPNRALPPTPPGSGSERAKRANCPSVADQQKELPRLPSHKIISKLRDTNSHAAYQMKRTEGSSTDTTNDGGIHARVEALEKQNALLSAALEAIIRTNGEMNGPIPKLPHVEVPRPPAAWETRLARRSAASQIPPSRNNSAMKLYHSTRREVK